MKRILAIVGRDVRSGLRDWLIVYLSIAPFLIAFILRALIPGVGDSLVNVVLLEDDPLRPRLERIAQVETVATLEKMEERVLRMDDIYGVLSTDSGFELIRQGNEIGAGHEMLEVLLTRLSRPDAELPVAISFSDIGWEISPLKLHGGNLLLLMTTVFGGMFIVLNLVDEKMHNTLKALNVSPLTRLELVAGKGILGFILPVIGCLGSVWILGFDGVHYGMLLLSILSIACISVIIGFSVGVVSDEPITAVASMKIIFLPVLLSVFGAMYLPGNLLWLLYWSPFYWAFESVRAILLQEAQWLEVIRNTAIITGITAITFIVLKKRIRNGLN
ncbi:ABC transporter permease [Spirochaeta dissipatitropha]